MNCDRDSRDPRSWLNGIPFKILGNANHQDYAAVGVAVPDHLQWHRVSKLKEMGVTVDSSGSDEGKPATPEVDGVAAKV